MSRNTKKRLGKLAVVAGLLVTALPLSNLVGAEGATSITLHKLAYQNDVTEVKNTGDEMDVTQFGSATRTWNKEKDGVVKFTVYKLDKSQLSTDKKPQTVADEVGAAVEAGGNLPYGAVKVGDEIEVDGTGLAKFNNLEDGTYVFLESTASGVVTQKAKPMLVSLPVAKEDGRANKDALHLYPKNKVNPVEVSFKKYIKKFGIEEALLQNNQSGFSLYRGEPGQGQKVDDSYQDLTSGSITVTDLTVGKYYFVEESKIDTSKPNYGPDGVIYDEDVVNGANNKLTFEYTSAGKIVFPENSLLKEGNKVVNHTKPNLDKEVDAPVFGFEEDITYTIKSEIPANINKYKTYKLTDTPSEAVNLNKETVAVSIVNKEGGLVKELVKDTDYTQSEAGRGFSLEFKVGSLATAPEGSSIKVTYKGLLDHEKAVTATDLENTARLDYDNNVVVDKEEDKAKVRTYEANLKKLDSGLFNSGVVKNSLQGAKFVVAKATGTESSSITKYLKVSEGKYVWVEDKAQATEFETNEEGMINVKGLNNGHYFFVETKAPEGYNMNTNPYSHFEINNANVKDATQIEVSNDRRTDMPITGTETTALVILGLGGLTVTTVIVKRRRDAKQDA